MSEVFLSVQNTKTVSAYPNTGVIVTIDPSIEANREYISWFYPGMEVTTTYANGIVEWVDRKGWKFCVMPANGSDTFNGPNLYKLTVGDYVYFGENKIGNQIWKTNDYLRTILKDGTFIPEVQDSGDWAALTTPAYCYNGSAPDDRIYNGYAILDPNFGLPGWRVPNSNDVYNLVQELKASIVGGYFSGVGKLKSTDDWTGTNTKAENYKGFNQLPVHYFRQASGSFLSSTIQSYTWLTPSFLYSGYQTGNLQASVNPQYWSFYSTSASADDITYWSTTPTSTTYKKIGLHVRLVRDYQPNAGIS